MAVKLSQSLKQSQSLMMTPQLQQAIKLLTLTHLEMTNVIASEMVENPLLEEQGMGDESAQQEIRDDNYKVDKLEGQNAEATAENFESPSLVEGNQNDFDWNKYLETYNSSSSSPPSMAKADSDDLPNYENMISRGMTLQEHLEWQLRMEELSSDQSAIATHIIHKLDYNGHLEVNFEELVAELDQDREEILHILEMIQNLDPLGCGSRSIQECLLIQAKAMGMRTPLIEKIITEYFKELQKRDYNTIIKKLGISKSVLMDAAEIILSFNPRPGRLISAEDTHYVVPDIFVKEVGGQFEVQVNDDGVPRLRISHLYRSMLQKGMTDDKTKEFVEDKLRSAMWLIKSIQNRQRTIVKVAEAIVKYQPEFFRKGPRYLRPMILKDIAQEIGMHESTVSRVTTNKYLHCSLGTFELKYFFNAGIGGKNGGIDIASESLKIKVKSLIDAENKSRPISDQKIVELLKREDIQVARRTVAKYREMLGILPSSKRKVKA